MQLSEFVEKLKAELGEKARDFSEHSEKRIYCEVAPEDLTEVVRHLWEVRRFRFSIATGTHTPTGFEVLYHFAADGDGKYVSVRVKAPDAENPRLPTLTGLIRGTDFIERELRDLLGIEFDGRTETPTLLRAEDWPDDFFPLRRDEPRALPTGEDGRE